MTGDDGNSGTGGMIHAPTATAAKASAEQPTVEDKEKANAQAVDQDRPAQVEQTQEQAPAEAAEPVKKKGWLAQHAAEARAAAQAYADSARPLGGTQAQDQAGQQQAPAKTHGPKL